MDEHVTDDQINAWLSDDQIPSAAHNHLDECSSCRSRYERFRILQKKIEHLHELSSNSAGRQGVCPPIEVWASVATGSSPQNEEQLMIAHAAGCLDCAELLNAALTDEISVDAVMPDSAMIDRWAAKLRDSAHPPPSRWRRRALYFSGAIAAALVVAVVVIRSGRFEATRTNRLLAKASTEKRTMAMRFPGAAYSRLSQERAPGASEEPRSLMEAELTISASPSHESDPHWLEIRGRAALLKWDFDRAIQAFDRAQSLGGADRALAADLLADLGLAYFERGEAEGRGADYSASAELLSKAIALAPSNALLYFNRALAYERLYFYSQAAADWKEAIRLEPNGGWADEARASLAAIEEKKRSEIRLPTPRAYLERRSSDLDPEYELRPATESWIDLIGKEDSSDAREALDALAADLEARHQDRWMRDLVRALHHPLGRQGYLVLAQAVQANVAGQNVAAEEYALQAEALFKTMGNSAGALFAWFERALAQQRALRRAECAETTRKLAQSIPSGYPWLLAQVWIERGVCQYHAGDLGDSWRDLANALEIAAGAGYREAAHRAVSYQNDYRAELGDANGAWESNLAGLSETWSGPHEPFSPFHFYSGIETLASRAGHWNTALAATREAMNAVSFLNNPSILAVHHYQSGSLALSAGQATAASKEFELARNILLSIPKNNQTRAYLFGCELGRAEAEATAGDVASALERLRSLSNELDAFSDTGIERRYYELLGELALSRGDQAAAARALDAARRLTIQNRGSLQDVRQHTVWRNDQRRLYQALLKLAPVQSGEAWSLWREYRGGDIPADAGDFIAFAVLPERVLGWARRGSQVVPFSSPVASADLERLVSRFRKACADPEIPLDQVHDLGRQLYAILLAPLGDGISGPIVIEPDGPVAGLPWEALTTNDGEWAGKRSTFVVALEGAHSSDEPRIDRNSRALIVAATGPGRQNGRVMQPLPGADREARNIGAMFRDPTVLSDQAASFSQIQKEIPQAVLFHFAGHHGGTGLLLSNPGGAAPGALDVGAFATGSRRCRLAVLSACKTATAAAGDEWDPDTLIHTLHRLGVPAVVASRWAVDSERTADFMTEFYASLLTGAPPASALQHASETIRERPDSQHPYYWAAFANFVK